MLAHIVAGLALALPSGSYAPAPASSVAEKHFTLENKSGFAVVRFNASPAGKSEWGPNRLGRALLKNGESTEIVFPDNSDVCVWDLRAVYEDDDTTEMKDVDLCEVGSITLNP